MAIKCGKCSNYHETTDEVRRCYSGETIATVERPVVKSNWPPSEAQVKYVLGLQVERDVPAEYDVKDYDTLATMDKAEVSRLIQELKGLPYKAPKGAKTKWSMPAGRYALLGDDEHWHFYQVDDGKGPRWEGYKFCVILIGAPGQYQKVKMGASVRENVMGRIERDSKRAMIDYGLHSGVCGRCSSPLSDPDSLARGIGPKCASKMGWS